MKFKLKNLLYLVFITSALIYFCLIVYYRHEISIAFQQVANLNFVLIFIIASSFLFFGYLIRAYKMDKLIGPIKPIKLKNNLRSIFVGYLFDLLLPLRIGQLIRAYILANAEAISAGYIFTLIVFERSIDAIILGLLSVFAFNYSQLIIGIDLSRFTPIGMALVILGLLLLLIIQALYSQNKYLLKTVHYSTSLLNPSLRDKLRLSAWSVIYGLQKTLKPKALKKYVLLSIVMWLSYILATYALALFIFGIENGFKVFIQALSPYLGLAVPVGPAYFGAYISVTQNILNVLSSSQANNTFLVISWFLLVVPTSIVGVYALFKTRENFRKLKKARQSNDMHDKMLRSKDISSELQAFLDSYFSNNTLSHILHKIELNEDVSLVKYFKGGSNASTILIHEEGQYKVRKITPIQHAGKLIDQYRWLKDRKKLNNIANIKGVKKDNNYYSFDIEYYDGYIPFFDFIHTHDIKESIALLEKAINYMYKNVYKQKRLRQNNEALHKYIQKRFINKITETEKLSQYFEEAVLEPTLIINGKKYTNCLNVLKKIQNNSMAMKDLASYRETPVHGDLTIDNILASTRGNNDFIIIDPNDENEISSAVIDFAKLFQSLEFGYEFLCRDNNPVYLKNGCIDFENSKSAGYDQLYAAARKIASKKLAPTEFRSVDFHVGMVYLRMLPYRAKINPDNILKFYAVATMAFNNYYSQYEKHKVSN